MESIQIGKEKTKLFLFADDRVLYIGNPKAISLSLSHTNTHTHTPLVSFFKKLLTNIPANSEKFVYTFITKKKLAIG